MQSMITTQLLCPQSIVVVGASNNTHKPGGAILKNLINGGYQGELRAVNPKETEVQGVPSFADAKELPDTDLAILRLPEYRQNEATPEHNGVRYSRSAE